MYQIMILDLQFLVLMMLVINYVFDIRKFSKFFSLPIKVEFKFNGVVTDNTIGYALVFKNEFVSISSDGQRHFLLIFVHFSQNITIFFHC